MTGQASVPIALFLCSYRRDLLRAERLLRSISLHNVESLPVCVAVPESDLDLFRARLPDARVTWVAQESVFTLDPSIDRRRFTQVSGSIRQQVVKAEAWRLNLAPNLMVLDSDCVFIRPFGVNDLLDRNGLPWSLRNSTLLDAVERFDLHKVRPDLERTSNPIRVFFGTQDRPLIMYGSAPFVWSKIVWEAVHTQWLRPRAWTCVELIEHLQSECLIYSEAARALGYLSAEPPREELFKCYHYVEQWWHDQLHGIREAHLANDYLGVVYQSNWQHELDFDVTKSSGSLASRKVRRMIRWIRWRLKELFAARVAAR